MTASPDKTSRPAAARTGLRSRKKAKRRQDILREAGKLFNQNGFDATTMAEIAEASSISPPTVFNYFGSKENILSALLFEGAERERTQHLAQPRQAGQPFAEIMGDLLCELSQNTMRIAGKRVWRYAEAASIRRAASEFQRLFTASDRELLRLIETFLRDYDIGLRSGREPDPGFVAQLFFDRWTGRYYEYIKDDQMPMNNHFDALREDVHKIVDLLFAPDFAAEASLKTAERAE